MEFNVKYKKVDFMPEKKWGGKREGAGRPKGTNNKKQYTFRLSLEELSAVRELLAKMRGKLVIFFCLMALYLPVSAQTLQGGVTYTEETARQEAFEDVYQHCPFPNVQSFDRSLFVASISNDDVLSMQEFNTKILKLIPYNVIGIVYKDLPNYIYYYEKTETGYKGVAIDIIFNTPYPNKTVKYDAKTGKLLSISFNVSEYESFVYDTDKRLIAHWQGLKCNTYNNKLKISRKIINSGQ